MYKSRLRRLYPRRMADIGVADNEPLPGMNDNPIEPSLETQHPAGEGVASRERPGMHPVASPVGVTSPTGDAPAATDEDPVGNYIENPHGVIASAATNMDALSRPEIGGTGRGEYAQDALDKPEIESRDNGEWGIAKEAAIRRYWRVPR